MNQAPVMRSLRRLLRLDKRKRLREALAGTWEQRWAYCWQRQMIVSETDLRTYGEVRYGERTSASRLLHQYARLTRLAERWANRGEQ